MGTLTLYNNDNTLFDNLVLPDKIDKQTLIDNILMETAELEVLYPNPDTLKYLIGKWSASQLTKWDTWVKVLMADDYDPFKNTDRTEEITDTTTRELNRNEAREFANSGESDGTNNIVNGNTQTGQVSAYNSGTWNNDTKVEDAGSSNQTTQNSSSASGNESKDTTDNETTSFSHLLHTYGDSAVDSNQTIIEKEVKLRQLYNVYDLIVNDYKHKFCLCVY